MILIPDNPFSEALGDQTTAPVGAVVPYAGALYNPKGTGSATADTKFFWINQRLALQGWLVCDGRKLWVAKYFDLFRVIGTIYGSGSSAFNLPDYRAQFMRGQNLGRKDGGDPDVAYRTGQQDNKEDNVGTTQGAMVQTHQHNYLQSKTATPAKGSPAAGPPTAKTATTDLLDIEKTKVPETDWGHETRPVNIYVNYLIKYAVEPAHIVPIGIEENPPTN